MKFPNSHEIGPRADDMVDEQLVCLTQKITSKMVAWSSLPPEIRKTKSIKVDLDPHDQFLWEQHGNYLTGKLAVDAWQVEYRPTPDYGHDVQPGDIPAPPHLRLLPN